MRIGYAKAIDWIYFAKFLVFLFDLMIELAKGRFGLWTKELVRSEPSQKIRLDLVKKLKTD